MPLPGFDLPDLSPPPIQYYLRWEHGGKVFVLHQLNKRGPDSWLPEKSCPTPWLFNSYREAMNHMAEYSNRNISVAEWFND